MTGATLLITGTAMGIGMMALPVATKPGGFIPASMNYFLCWLFAVCTGLLLLEACLWMPAGSSFMTMTKRLLGPLGGHLFWSFYFIFFLMGMVAHVIEGGQTLNLITSETLPPWMGSIVYSFAFFPLIYLGVNYVERLNIILVSLAAIAFGVFIYLSYHQIDLNFVHQMDFAKSWPALPIIMFAFGYQLIIPTLTTFMRRNVKKMRIVIIVGITIPLIFYLIWEFVILGIDSAGALGELSAFRYQGMSSVNALTTNPALSYLLPIGITFAFLTPAASFATFSLSFRDFLADGMEIEKQKIKKALLCFFLFLIPLSLALIYPDLFSIAIRYAGGINMAIIFGLMPPLMVWIGRYQKHYQTVPPQVGGGRPVLVLLILFALFNIAIQLIFPFPTH